jgi:hypothetical protein
MAAPARKPEPAPPSASDRLASAQAALEETNRKLAELDQRRNECLLADDNEGAIKHGIAITSLKLEARAHADKIELLRGLVEKEAAEIRAKDREALVGKLEAKLAQRDKAMADVGAAIKQLASASERAIKLGREVIDAWPSWPMHDLPPALLTPAAILSVISHELFRASHHPRRYGGADTDPLAGHELPGSRPPTLQLAEDPARVRSLNDVVRDASEFARRFLHTGKGSAGGPNGPPMTATNGGDFGSGASEPQRTDAERRRGELWRQLDDPALDDNPTLKAEVVAALAQVEDEIAHGR